MGAPDEGSIATHSRAHNRDADDIKAPKIAAEQKTTIEVSEERQTEDAPKTYYSKLSIWLMILYSGLAIGSYG
jgi:hypothetical protein